MGEVTTLGGAMSLTPYEFNYVALGVMLLLAVGFAVAPLALAWLLSPKKPSQTKNATYECGLVASGDPWAQLKVHYYLYALSFLIFSLEIIFIIPLALVLKEAGWWAFFSLSLFLLILAAGLVYEWAKGALEWD